MAWLTSLLKKPEANEEETLLEAEAPEAYVIPSGPQLAILVPDANGISSFRIRFAPNATLAADQISGLRGEVRHETHAFWAMQDKPIVDANTQVEALVLIRANADSDLVYVVSFLDLESALSFTRFEVRRGLHLGNVMIYWAAFTQLREEFDGISIHPQFAPPTEMHAAPVMAPPQLHIVAPTVEVEPEVESSIDLAPERTIQPEPEVETVVEAEAREAVETYLRKRAEKPAAPVIEESIAVAEPEVIEEQIVEMAPEPIVIQPEPEPIVAAQAVVEPMIEEDEELGPMWPEASLSATAEAEIEAEVPELISPVAEEQAAINEAFVFQHKTVEFRPQSARHNAMESMGEADGMLIDQREPIATFGTDARTAERLAAQLGIGAPEPGIETIPGDEEMEFVPLNSAGLDAAGLPITPKLDDFDVAYEVERLLRHRKWDKRDGPFSGFQSPPGRF